MGDDLFVTVRPYCDLTHRKPLAEFEQPALGHEIAGVGLAQEIDVQIGGDGERHRPDRGEQGHLHRNIGERHHGWAGDRPAGPHEPWLIGLSHAPAAMPDRLDREPASRVKRLRKILREEPFERLDIHHRLGHPIPLAVLAHGLRSDTMAESGAQRLR